MAHTPTYRLTRRNNIDGLFTFGNPTTMRRGSLDDMFAELLSIRRRAQRRGYKATPQGERKLIVRTPANEFLFVIER